MSLYMFRGLNAHLQEDTLYIYIYIYIYAAYGTVIVNSLWWPVGAARPPQTLVESDSTICCMYTLCPPEDEHLRLETCRGT